MGNVNMPRKQTVQVGKLKKTQKAVVTEEAQAGDKFVGRKGITKQDWQDLKEKVEKGRRHKFMGQDEAEAVVRWLQDPKRPANDAVEQLVGLEVRYRSGDLEAGRETVDLWNEAVRKWKLGLVEVGSFSTSEGRTFKPTSTAHPGEVPPAQHLAFHKAIELMKAGLLHRVRRCKREGCGKWFFGIFDHSLFDSEECRTKQATTGEAFKERRKKYMRKLRMGKKGGK
jgi:hypothetical protein